MLLLDCLKATTWCNKPNPTKPNFYGDMSVDASNLNFLNISFEFLQLLVETISALKPFFNFLIDDTNKYGILKFLCLYFLCFVLNKYIIQIFYYILT